MVRCLPLLATLFFAARLHGQVDQHAIAEQLLQGDFKARSNALEQARVLGPKNTGAELRAALIELLEKNNRTVELSRQRKQPLSAFENPEFVTHVGHVVSQLGHPDAMPALAGALGTGSTFVRDALADFGDRAAANVLRVVTAPATHPDAVAEGLTTLRFLVEGAGTPRLSTAKRREIRGAAKALLTGKYHFTTVWQAIDLGVALKDRELRSIVGFLAASRDSVATRGITSVDLIQLTQGRAKRRLSGEPILPKYRPPAERARQLEGPGGP